MWALARRLRSRFPSLASAPYYPKCHNVVSTQVRMQTEGVNGSHRIWRGGGVGNKGRSSTGGNHRKTGREAERPPRSTSGGQPGTKRAGRILNWGCDAKLGACAALGCLR